MSNYVKYSRETDKDWNKPEATGFSKMLTDNFQESNINRVIMADARWR